MARKYSNGIDLLKSAIINVLVHPASSDPSSPSDSQVWYRTDTDRFMGRADGVSETFAFLSDVTGEGITGDIYDANTVLVADTDNNPVARVIAEGTVLGRLSGGSIAALTDAQIRTLINVENGATADMTAAEILAALLTVDGPSSGLNADLLDGTELASLATITYVDTEIDAAVSALVDAAPGTLDTLNELAAALGDDANFATTVTNSLATKASKYAQNIGNGTDTEITVTHNLGTTDVSVTVYTVGGSPAGEEITVDVYHLTSNTVRLDFAVAPTTDQYRVVVIG